MAKAEQRSEGWDAVDEFIGAGDLTLLTDDGESVTFVVVGAPIGMKSERFKTESKRVVIPIVTADGLSVIPLNARTYRKVSRHKAELKDHAVRLTRHGEPNSTETFYEVVLADMEPSLRDLKAAVTPDAIKGCLDSALEVLSKPQ